MKTMLLILLLCYSVNIAVINPRSTNTFTRAIRESFAKTMPLNVQTVLLAAVSWLLINSDELEQKLWVIYCSNLKKRNPSCQNVITKLGGVLVLVHEHDDVHSSISCDFIAVSFLSSSTVNSKEKKQTLLGNLPNSSLQILSSFCMAGQKSRFFLSGRNRTERCNLKILVSYINTSKLYKCLWVSTDLAGIMSGSSFAFLNRSFYVAFEVRTIANYDTNTLWQ